MLALIIVYYNKPNNLKEFLGSLSKNIDQDFCLFITDLSKKLQPTKLYQFDEEIIQTANKGYSHGINACLKMAVEKGYDQFCVLNYDITFDKNLIKNIKKRFKKSQIFSGKIYYEKGYEYHKQKYTNKELGQVLWYAGGLIDWKHATTTHQGVDEVDKQKYDKVEKTEFIPGTLFCFDQEVFNKVGYWDEKFFLYYEDTDYSVRAKEAGFNLIYDPNIVIYHKNAGSTGGSGSKLHIHQQTRSRLIFGLKHAPNKTKFHLLKNFVFDYFK